MYNPTLSFHFIGIGGSGMSGIAEVLLTLRFSVSGSELKSSPITDRLRSLGAVIAIGHSANNIPQGCSSVVYSSAVSQLNVEMVSARERGIPCVRRAEVLAELMRLKFGVAVAGSHGKTTTTSMTAAVLAGLDPTVIVGGQLINSNLNLTAGSTFHSGARLGQGQYLIAESDESDKSFLLLKPTVAVITNIDAEHLGTYGTLPDLKDAFLQFAESVPFYGLCVLCIDDPAVRALSTKVTKRTLTYGFSSDADVRAENLALSPSGATMDVFIKGAKFSSFTVPMLGRHLALNSLAAIAVAYEFAIDPNIIAAALKSFGGVRRRLEHLAVYNGAHIYSDYGHHPTEIIATIRALRESFTDAGLLRLIVIFQPHRYTRTAECFDEFCRAFGLVDHLILTEIYAAGEQPIEGISSERLLSALVNSFPADGRTSTTTYFAPSFSAAIQQINSLNLGAGDYVLCLGAGSIGSFAETLASELTPAGSIEGTEVLNA